MGVSDPPGYIAGAHWLIKRDLLIKKKKKIPFEKLCPTQEFPRN